MTRDLFMIDLHKKLTKPQQSYRFQNMPNMKRDLRSIISKVLENEEETTEDQRGEVLGNQKGPRKYCHICPTARKRMTTTYCPKCNKPICGEHTAKMCFRCFS